MIAAWMLYALAASLLLALAAGAADRAARALGGATRWAWAGALAASLLVPAAAWWWRPAPEPIAAATPAATGDAISPEALLALAEAGAPSALDALLARATLHVTPAAAWRALDLPLGALWSVGSLALLLSLALAQHRLHRARREWRRAVVRGAPVLVAGRTGPAVAGVWRTAVVLPEWALASDAGLLGLMLAHEREHERAGDPRLLALATLAVALMPWNAALWYQRRRLRLAVEIDCDRRVLRRHPDVARYGALLLEVGRRAAGPALPLAALTSTTSSLERRIRIMTMRRPRHALARGAALLGASALVATAALAMPRPAQPPVSSSGIVTAADEAAAYRDVTPEQVIAAIRQAIPQLLEEETGMVATIYFVVDADGNIVRARFDRRPVAEQATATAAAVDPSRPRAVAIRKADHDMLDDIDPGAISSIDVLKFAPGRAIPDSADVVWVQLRSNAATGEGGAAAGGSGGGAVDARTLRADQARAARASAIVRGTTAGSAAAVDTAGTYTMRGTAGTYRVQGAAGTYRAEGIGGTYRMRDSADLASARRAATDSALSRALARRAATDAALRRAIVQGDAAAGEPLYIVDGVIVQPGDREVLDYLPPESIDNIEVVKGAAAAARYGDRAAGGIISITTKSGAASAAGGVGTTVGGGVRVTGGASASGGRVTTRAPRISMPLVDSVDGDPLYVIDGVVIEAGDPAVRELAPERIESIEVVKGAAATAVHGARAAHGVIEIRTKPSAPPPGR